MTVINPTTDAAFVALLGTGDQTQEIGVARFSVQADGQDCEFAVTVADAWQRKKDWGRCCSAACILTRPRPLATAREPRTQMARVTAQFSINAAGREQAGLRGQSGAAGLRALTVKNLANWLEP